MVTPGTAVPGDPGRSRPSYTAPGQAKTTPTWSEVARGAVRRPEEPSHRLTAGELEDLQRRFPRVAVVPEERVAAARNQWRETAVIAKSLGRRVSPELVARELRSRGKLKNEVEVLPMMEGFVTIRFASGDDRAAALAAGPWVVAGQLLAMEKWVPDFIPGTHSVNRTVVWVRLPGLPVEYWDMEAIRVIVAEVGNPLELDRFSHERRRIGYARVKVEINVRQPLIPGTIVQGVQARFWQTFAYEDLPGLCYRCARLDHLAGDCCYQAPGTHLGTEAEGQGAETVGQGETASGSEAPPQMTFGPWMTVPRQRHWRNTGAPGGVKKTMEAAESARRASLVKTTPETVEVDLADSSPDTEGWRKPKKVARRGSPGKGSGQPEPGVAEGVQTTELTRHQD
ncbi:uncharacterized protein LOC120107839 [Phoenix dactylifera]|uniref:Uncharacterized protein LOC120107839 n=1 Tax=Phoenix dactylifera TaxID=42345 RepID=A0A8B8ZV63_PHODC|nr:uncharacterized protein LOC120107839 [Phoenix dactylifera]